MDTTLATKLCSLMLSEDYEDWLQAWDLLRDHMPASVTTFGALDDMLNLEAEGCSINQYLRQNRSELGRLNSV